ncbi:MAG: hypothetical protein ACRD3L_01460 [Terriglobales bacterium]
MQKPSETLTRAWDILDDLNSDGLRDAIRTRIATASAELAAAISDLKDAEL